MPIFHCPMCSKEFKSYDKKRVYCGRECLAKSKIKTFTDKQVCPTCEIEKERKEFWVNNSKSSGLHYQCIECSKAKYVDKTTPEFLEKERKRSLRKMRLIRGIDPEFKGNYKTGPKANPNTRWDNGKGYYYILRKGHPNAHKTGKMFEHTWVMSEYLKRPLTKLERVHHKNGIRSDNRIDNLEIWHIGQPPGQRVEDKIAWCKEFLDQYGYDVTQRKDS